MAIDASRRHPGLQSLNGRTATVGFFRVNPTTGTRIVLSDFGDPAQGKEGGNPTGVTVDVSNILVIDLTGGWSGLGVLFSVGTKLWYPHCHQ